jgi:hypothetical protein
MTCLTMLSEDEDRRIASLTKMTLLLVRIWPHLSQHVASVTLPLRDTIYRLEASTVAENHLHFSFCQTDRLFLT